eukprot:g3036.t1
MPVARDEIRVAFVQTLKLLGYDGLGDENHQARGAKDTLRGSTLSRIRKSRGRAVTLDMFEKSNANALYSVMHFLFMRLDPRKYGPLFEDCWPLHDNNQVRAFRRIIHRELKALEADGLLPTGLVQASLLTSPQGIRAERLVWRLSTHILSKEVENVSGYVETDSATDRETLRNSIKALDARALFEAEKFKLTAENLTSAQGLWKERANKIVQEYRNLESRVSTLREALDKSSVDEFSNDESIKKANEMWSVWERRTAPGSDLERGIIAARILTSTSPQDDTKLRLNVSDVVQGAHACSDHVQELCRECTGHSRDIFSANEEALPLLGGELKHGELSNLHTRIEAITTSLNRLSSSMDSIQANLNTLNWTISVENWTRCGMRLQQQQLQQQQQQQQQQEKQKKKKKKQKKQQHWRD